MANAEQNAQLEFEPSTEWIIQRCVNAYPEAGRSQAAVGALLVEYLVVIEKGDTSYGAYVPDLPGCVAVGESRREVLKLIREGIELHIEALREAGEPVPRPTSKSELIKVDAA
jgi:predicted RNase H-like HicB family nuclease